MAKIRKTVARSHRERLWIDQSTRNEEDKLPGSGQELKETCLIDSLFNKEKQERISARSNKGRVKIDSSIS